MSHYVLLVSGHISSCPRAVKFADTFAAEGHRVDVISVPVLPELLASDASVSANRRWRHHPTERAVRWLAPIRRRVANAMWRFAGHHESMAMAAEGAGFHALRRAIRRMAQADVVWAFNLPAVSAALTYCRATGVPLGVDVEDDFVEMLPDDPANQFERRRRAQLLAAAAATATWLTTASPMMASDLSRQYRRDFVTLLNVFDPCPRPARGQSSGHGLGFVWHSQTIGPGRGIEEFLQVMRFLPGATLSMRGRCAPGYRKEIEDLAGRIGLRPAQIDLLEPIDPGRLIAAACPFDVGLSLELSSPRNRAHCLTNKLFEFLSAGLPLVLSDTPAQVQIASELGAAACVVDLNDPQDAARRIQASYGDATALGAAKHAAAMLSANQFNWAQESNKLRRLINAPPQVRPCVS